MFTSNNNLLFLILFSWCLLDGLKALDFSQTKMCEGNMLCSKDCSNCKLCDQTTCKLESNCYCASKKIPGNIPLAETPQFFFFTFDDSVHETGLDSLQVKLDFWRKNASLFDNNKCPLKPTIFAMNIYSDFGFISYLSKIGEVSIHATTHTTSFHSTYRKWKNELYTCYNDIVELAQIVPIGGRAAYLETNDDYFRVLKELNIKYDFSFLYYPRSYNQGKTADQVAYWPFTLDFGFPEASMGWSSALQLTERIPGMWEFPNWGFQYADGKEYEVMDYTISKTFLEDFKRDFELNYKTNRAPLGLYFHEYYFINSDWTDTDYAKLQLYADLLKWVMSHDKVLYATPSKVMNWMKNPKPFSETIKTADFACPPPLLTPQNPCNNGVPKTTCTIKNLPWNTCQDQCPDGTFSFNICGDQCPDNRPDIDILWEYDEKERSFITEPFFFDEVQPESNKNYYHFYGEAFLDTPLNGTYSEATGLFGPKGWFCSNIIVKNNNEFEGATGFIFSIDTCGKKAKFTSTFGYPIENFSCGSMSGFRMLGKNIQIMRYFEIVIGTLCMEVNLDGKNTFKLDSLKMGVDLYNQTLRCDFSGENKCQVFCGNKLKDNGETSQNCPIDFENNNC